MKHKNLLIAIAVVIVLGAFVNYQWNYDKRIYVQVDQLIEEKRYDEAYVLVKKIRSHKFQTEQQLRMNYVYRYCGYYGSTDFKECVRGLENCDIVNLTEEMLEGFSEDRLKIWQDSFDYYLSVLETEYNYDLEHAMSILNIKSVHVRETALVEQSHLIKDGRLIDPNDLDPDLLTFEGVRYKYRD